jgi:hypothetical protein
MSENRELDAQVAEQVMGWRNTSNAYVINGLGGDDPAQPNRGIQRVPRYSASIEAAMQVENRIAELGLQTRYVLELAKIVDPRSNRNDAVMSLWWALVHATSEQRCRSAYAAVKDQNGEGDEVK